MYAFSLHGFAASNHPFKFGVFCHRQAAKGPSMKSVELEEPEVDISRNPIRRSTTSAVGKHVQHVSMGGKIQGIPSIGYSMCSITCRQNLPLENSLASFPIHVETGKLSRCETQIILKSWCFWKLSH